MPDFLVIGAAKAGTSALSRMLALHPDVFLPQLAEPGWFAWRDDGPLRRWPTPIPALLSVRDAASYGALYAGASHQQRCGDVSPIYLESPVAVDRAPAACRIVATLRDPADRAWSAYWMHRRDGLEAREPGDAFDVAEHRVQVGFYGRLLRSWFDRFGEVHVLFVQEWTGEDGAARRGLAEFLGLDPEPWGPAPAKVNVGGVPRWSRLDRAAGAAARHLPAGLADGARALRDRARAPLPAMPAGLRAELGAIYEEDRAELRALLGRELPW
jgi:hypothetical protein